MNNIITKFDDFLNEKVKHEHEHDPEVEVRNRGDVCFPAESPLVNDDKDHFPINSKSQSINALSRVNQYSESPKWFNGSLKKLKSIVVRKVHKKYPDIEIAELKKDDEE